MLGNIKLTSFIYNASGAQCTTKNHLDELSRSPYVGAVLTKSCTIEPREGNEHPRYSDDGFGSINSNGLCNEGYKFYGSWRPPVDGVRKPYIISVAGPTQSDTITILTSDELRSCDAVELNTSCPNIESNDGGHLAYNSNDFYEYLRIIMEATGRTIVPYGLKLPPFWFPEQFDNTIDNVLNEFNPSFITCCNSLPNGLFFDSALGQPDIKPKNGFGGVGGRYLKPISLANVAQFKRRNVRCSIVGCGGVSTGRDVREYEQVGASAVQIGTELMRNGVDVFEAIYNEYRYGKK